MLEINEVIIVEGKYDKIKLTSIVRATILETNGFRIFKDKEKMNLIKKFAKERGIIVLTDSDAAGFLIRNYINSCIGQGKIYHAYIPDCLGKEKRKEKVSKEGKLGVEGMNGDVIKRAIMNAMGANERNKITNAISREAMRIKFYEAGLSGGEFSRVKRKKLKEILSLPEYLSTNSMIDVIRCGFKESEIDKILNEI